MEHTNISTIATIRVGGIKLFYKIKDVKALANYRLSVGFINGEERIYDINPLFNKWASFKSLIETNGLFKQVRVDNGGYGISWNDEIDLECNELYFNGIPIIAPHELYEEVTNK